jgi:hypothetical protein
MISVFFSPYQCPIDDNTILLVLLEGYRAIRSQKVRPLLMLVVSIPVLAPPISSVIFL